MSSMDYLSFLVALGEGDVALGRPEMTIEFLPPDKALLPRVRFMWNKKVYVSNVTEEQYADMSEEVRESFSKSSSSGSYYTFARKVEQECMILCNFRRYSWAYTDDPKGLTGYGGGVVYANGNDGGLNCSSSEQVVRETLVRTLCKMEHRGCPSKLLYGQEGRGLVQKLLKDALENPSSEGFHLSPIGSSNGPLDDEVVVL
jgi:hypothetical protein